MTTRIAPGEAQALLRGEPDLPAPDPEPREALYAEMIAMRDRIREMLQAVEDDLARLREAVQVEHLTDREREILRLIARGATNQQIGQALGIGTGTAKNYVAKILYKLKVTDRTQAAVRAHALGAFDLDEGVQ